MPPFLLEDRDLAIIDAIASSSESESPSPSLPSSPEPRKEVRYQSLYDAVADRSRKDRFLNPPSSKTAPSRAAAPETILASRWRRQLQRSGENVLEDEDVKLSEAGLVVPSDRNEGLPDSVVSFKNGLTLGFVGCVTSVCGGLLSHAGFGGGLLQEV